MLAKRYRLPIQSVVKKSGQTIKGRYFLLKIFDNSLGYNRFGVIISKKAAKKAALRNKLKRIIMDVFGPYVLSGGKKRDFLIIVSPQIINLKPEAVKKEILGYVQNFFN